MKRYYVQPCDESDGTRQWDIWERANPPRPVATLRTRSKARREAAKLNAQHEKLGDGVRQAARQPGVCPECFDDDAHPWECSRCNPD